MYYIGSVQNVTLLAQRLNETHLQSRTIELKKGEKITDPFIALNLMHGFAPVQDMLVREFIPLSQKP